MVLVASVNNIEIKMTTTILILIGDISGLAFRRDYSCLLEVGYVLEWSDSFGFIIEGCVQRTSATSQVEVHLY